MSLDLESKLTELSWALGTFGVAKSPGLVPSYGGGKDTSIPFTPGILVKNPFVTLSRLPCAPPTCDCHNQKGVIVKVDRA